MSEQKQPDFSEVEQWLASWQDTLCAALEREDGGARFLEDRWSRQEGGGGLSRVLKEGHLFERLGVNFSSVQGRKLPPSATAARPQLAGASFRAAGVSLVAHPVNPHVPAAHANLRFFQAETSGKPAAWWFGGGYDLTPCYGYAEDCRHWHKTARAACEPFGAGIYPRLKKWCDDYFYLPHRGETRGIGGLFFDDFCEWDFARCFGFVRAVGESFTEAYLPILKRRRDMPYGERERDFQLYRRGRYAEFNLVYDRGTLFGLQSGGRTESILMSLPPLVRWDYNWCPETGSEEERLYREFLPPRDWARDDD